jgi:hypothetical protein
MAPAVASQDNWCVRSFPNTNDINRDKAFQAIKAHYLIGKRCAMPIRKSLSKLSHCRASKSKRSNIQQAPEKSRENGEMT